MIREIRIFKVSEPVVVNGIAIGANVQPLLEKSLITPHNKVAHIDFECTENENIWLQIKHQKITRIILRKRAIEDFLPFNPKSFPYPQTNPISQFLSNQYTFIKDLESVDESPCEGNYMTIIFKDYLPKMILLETKNGQQT